VPSRAAAEAPAALLGTDHVGFTATWVVEGSVVERSFNKFTAAAKEAGKSRIALQLGRMKCDRALPPLKPKARPKRRVNLRRTSGAFHAQACGFRSPAAATSPF
jgi:hypothetical protein